MKGALPMFCLLFTEIARDIFQSYQQKDQPLRQEDMFIQITEVRQQDMILLV